PPSRDLRLGGLVCDRRESNRFRGRAPAPAPPQAGWLMPARWAVAGAGTTLDLAHTMPPWNLDKPDEVDPLWAHTVTQWGIDLGVLLAIGLVCGFAVARLLRRHEPEVMRD
ncbi:hypothetical protein ACFXEZ_28200, partial [Streptomyces hygroscopicus]